MGNCNCSANMLDELKNNQITLCNNPCGQQRRDHEFDFTIGLKCDVNAAAATNLQYEKN